ncbi:uroporphyrinogen decarboxylase [Mariniblastus fucicola]|uniref:Uroporphyrinogen decarboxylase n=1 Tax=Mariniblastus fucicola TaxID=980251 RepID=A0A5B9PPP0_9BACT|nr:uroporphyrinogen decarboxylase [Mariniblastus fucicola]QEG24451.1 Uroporphyrinogen decarboxylase [Mariniblastus fucicola]
MVSGSEQVTGSQQSEDVIGAFDSVGLNLQVVRPRKSSSKSSSDSQSIEPPPARTAGQISDFVGELLTGGVDVVVVMTASGVNSLIELASATTDRDRLLHALQDCRLVSGSAATTAALAKHDLTPDLKTGRLPGWRESLRWLESSFELPHQRIVLESTLQDSGLVAGLESRGVQVRSVSLGVAVEPYELSGFVSPEPATPTVLVVSSVLAARSLCRNLVAARLTNPTLDHHIVVALGVETADFLVQNGVAVELVADPDLQTAAQQLASNLDLLVARKQKLIMNMSGPNAPSDDTNAPWYDSPFMKACRGEDTDVTPIWMMRQAGRYMSEYREVRAKVSFLDLCANPQLCSEVMCTAVNRLGVDAAIIFSDLLPMLVPMGCDLEFVKGDGPVIHNPVRSAEDIDRIKPLDSNDELQFVMETVTQTRADLPADMPLIGFSGAPFTLASYIVEGGSSRNYAHAKALMFGDPGAWKELMQRLTDSIIVYLKGQIDAGAQCVQLFDSWAGCLNVQHYRELVLPFVQQIIAALPSEVPVINFGTGNPALLPLYADTEASVIGIDWRVQLDEAWETVGHDRAVQGNLDPTILLTDPATIRSHAKSILDQAAGRPGHIFNLGHGILPQTPVDNAIALVDAVHELSQR